VLGLRAFGSDHGEVFLGRDFASSQDYSDETAAKIDAEIHAIITKAYDRAKQILNDNIDKLHFIAEFLVKNEIMDGEQFKAAMEGTPTFEELEEMTQAKQRKSREENEERRRKQEEERRIREEEEKKAAEAEAEKKKTRRADSTNDIENDASTEAIDDAEIAEYDDATVSDENTEETESVSDDVKKDDEP